MLADFGLLCEELLGGTRQRVLPEAEVQNLASNAFWHREVVNSTHSHILLKEIQLKILYKWKNCYIKNKETTPQLYHSPTPQETQGSVDCMGKQATAETETLSP